MQRINMITEYFNQKCHLTQAISNITYLSNRNMCVIIWVLISDTLKTLHMILIITVGITETYV